MPLPAAKMITENSLFTEEVAVVFADLFIVAIVEFRGEIVQQRMVHLTVSS